MILSQLPHTGGKLISHLGDRISHITAGERAAWNGKAEAAHRHTPSEVGGSNRNLLDNWYFGSPINQRGQSDYTGSGYTIDRWNIYNSPTVTVTDEAIHFVGSSGKNSGFQQPIEHPTQYNGHTITVSALVKGKGTLIVNNVGTSVANMIGVGFNSKEYTLVSGTFVWSLTYPDGVANFLLWSSGSNPVDFYVKAAKLELGSVQTLAHQENGAWVLNDPPPNLALELAKCQRYQVMVANEPSSFICWCNAISSATALAYLYLSTPLRANPVCTINNCYLVAVDDSNAVNKILAGVSQVKTSGNILRFLITCTGGLSVGKAYQIYIPYSINGSLLLDANL